MKTKSTLRFLCLALLVIVAIQITVAQDDEGKDGKDAKESI
jgi:hypothetical protein